MSLGVLAEALARSSGQVAACFTSQLELYHQTCHDFANIFCPLIGLRGPTEPYSRQRACSCAAVTQQ
jgi:hypothetical protein